jgi:hypothetical protein
MGKEKLYNLKRNNPTKENTPAVKKQKHEQEPIIGTHPMLNFLLSCDNHVFSEPVSTAAASALAHKNVLQNVVNKEGYKNIEIKVLLDPGAEVPIISPYFMQKYNLTIVERKLPRPMRGFDGKLVKDTGKFFSLPLTFQYEDHWSRDVFEVSPLDQDIDALLPWWWWIKH